MPEVAYVTPPLVERALMVQVPEKLRFTNGEAPLKVRLAPVAIPWAVSSCRMPGPLTVTLPVPRLPFAAASSVPQFTVLPPP